MGYEARLCPFCFLGTRGKGQAHSGAVKCSHIPLRVATHDRSREIRHVVPQGIEGDDGGQRCQVVVDGVVLWTSM
jgi:hypothetical protein